MTSRRYAKGTAKRAEILDIAIGLIMERGYRDTSLRQIAAAADISLGGLMHYFSSREHLLTEVLRRRDARDMEEIEASEERPPESSVHWLATIMSTNMTRPRLVELYLAMAAASTDPSHPAHSYFTERFNSFRRYAAEALFEAQQRGEMPPGLDPRLLANNAIAVMDGIQMQWLLDSTIDMGAQVAAYLSGLGLR